LVVTVVGGFVPEVNDFCIRRPAGSYLKLTVPPLRGKVTLVGLLRASSTFLQGIPAPLISLFGEMIVATCCANVSHRRWLSSSTWVKSQKAGLLVYLNFTRWFPWC
jgi:hypothetical protein